MRPRILLAHSSPIRENPRTGGAQRLALMARHLESFGDVTRLHARRFDAGPARGYYRTTRALHEASLAGVLHPGRAAEGLRQRGAAAPCGVRPEDFDLVFVWRPGVAFWTGLFDPRRAILDIDDLPSQIHAGRLAREAGGPAARLVARARVARLRRGERRLAACFRFLLVASEDARADIGRPNVAVVPNAWWPRAGAEEPPGAPRPDIISFVGTLSWGPNQRGLAWFVERVWPVLRSAQPELRLRLVGHLRGGRELTASWANTPGVELVGPVDDVTRFVRESLCTICPLLDGSGTRIKIIESLALGTPVVSTTKGAEGLPLGEHEGLLRRDDPAAFSAAVLGLLAPKRRGELARAGQAAAHAQHSASAQREALRPLIEQILS